MKVISIPSLHRLCLIACAVFASTSALASSTGKAIFTTDERTYLGIFSTEEKLIAVDIDGLMYRGYYASHAEDGGGTTSGNLAGKWGRAFLFASSANILRCQLETSFPKATGQCQGADGRVFRLISDTQKKTASTPKRPAAR